MLKFFLGFLLFSFVHSLPLVEKSLYKLENGGSTNIVLTLTSPSAKEILQSLQNKIFNSRSERLNTITSTLKNAASQNQAEILKFLEMEKSPQSEIYPFWITNKIIVRAADIQLVQKLMNRIDIREIRQEKVIPIDPIQFTPHPYQPMDNPQWGITQVRAPEVWTMGNNGQGAVVANIDTGVRGTHEALASNYRGDYGWFDPVGQTLTPNDNSGHGTHTMGVIVGTVNGIGVAPGAQWISCKGCGSSACTELALLSCGQWINCPTDPTGTNPKCELAPHAVSNSWGGGQDASWYEDTIAAWRASGIVPLFGAGNNGPACGSIAAPGSSQGVITIGASEKDDDLATAFSGRGDATDIKFVKPNAIAPSTSIYSSYNTGNSAYATMSGSSMAVPHAAGLVALLVSQNPNLSVDEIQDAIQMGAFSIMNSAGSCGLTGSPNNLAGWGRIDCFKSVNLVRKIH